MLIDRMTVNTILENILTKALICIVIFGNGGIRKE